MEISTNYLVECVVNKKWGEMGVLDAIVNGEASFTGEECGTSR